MVAFNRVEVETFFFWSKLRLRLGILGYCVGRGDFGERKNGMTYKLYQ